MPQSKPFLARLFVLLLGAIACGGSSDTAAPPPPPPPAPVPTTATVAAGNSQKGFVKSPLPINPAVAVHDQRGNPMAGVAVVFAVTQGSGTVSSGTPTTDASGLASTVWTMGSSVGTNRLTATAQNLPQLAFEANADSPYNIELVYAPDVSLVERNALDVAIAHWRRAITTDIGRVQFTSAGGCGGFSIPAGEIISGLRVYVKDSAITDTKVLAQTGLCAENSVSKVPVVALLVWNSAQVAYTQGNGLTEIVATHELGHAIGFGTLWRERILLAGDGTSDPYFLGSQARSTFGSSFGSGYSGNAVPVENTGLAATQGSHWRETVFSRELMTGFVNLGTPNPMSAVTIAQFADLGYAVDMSQAEIFTGGFFAPDASAAVATRVDLGDDVARQPIRSVAPLRR